MAISNDADCLPFTHFSLLIRVLACIDCPAQHRTAQYSTAQSSEEAHHTTGIAEAFLFSLGKFLGQRV